MTLSTTTDLAWTIGDRLHKARRVAGISVEEMATGLGVSRNTIGNWETGRSTPRRQSVIAWAQLTGAPLDWLTGEAETSPLGQRTTSDVRVSTSGWKLNQTGVRAIAHAA